MSEDVCRGGEGRREIHLVGWDVMCRPKEKGGVGLRHAEATNKSLLLKLALRLLNHGNDRWAKIIHSKYGIDDHGPVIFKHKQRSSIVRKDLEWAKELLRKGLRWKVRNTGRVRF